MWDNQNFVNKGGKLFTTCKKISSIGSSPVFDKFEVVHQMEVLKTSETVLCNAEVIHFLRDVKAKLPKALGRKHQPSGGSAKAATIVLETLTYLEKTPATKYSPEKFEDFAQKLEDLKVDLTHAERLLILNHCPRTAVEIQLLIEDSEERLSDEQVEQLLDIIRSELLQEPEEQQPEEGSDENS